MAKAIVPLSSYKVLNDLFMAIFKAPKVEEEMVKVLDCTCHLPINPDFLSYRRQYKHSMSLQW